MFAVSVASCQHYQAGSWNKKRRVVAKVEWHRNSWFLASVSSVTDHLYAACLLVQAMGRADAAVYNRPNDHLRRMQHIKEGKNAINWTPSVMSTKASATMLVRLANSFTPLKPTIWATS